MDKNYLSMPTFKKWKEKLATIQLTRKCKKFLLMGMAVFLIVISGLALYKEIYKLIPRRYIYDNCPGDACYNCGWDDEINGICDPEYNPYKEHGIELSQERLEAIMKKHNISKDEVLKYVNKEIIERKNQLNKRQVEGALPVDSYVEEVQRLEGVKRILQEE